MSEWLSGCTPSKIYSDLQYVHFLIPLVSSLERVSCIDISEASSGG